MYWEGEKNHHCRKSTADKTHFLQEPLTHSRMNFYLVLPTSFSTLMDRNYLTGVPVQ